MKKYLAASLVLLALLAACDKEKDNNKVPVSSDESKITFGIIDTLNSAILRETRSFWVYTPSDTTKKYPLLVLLDGNAHYYSVAGMIHQLSVINGNSILPEMVVVAITNTDRTRDLTPTHVKEMFGDTIFAKTSGGAENFTKFIRDELLPYVDAKYHTTSHRTLVGHSFGGLFVINTLFRYPDMFSNYLAIDPSLWWDKQILLREAPDFLATNDYKNKSLFVAVANTMKPGTKVEAVVKDTSEATLHIRSILEFNKMLEKIKGPLQFTGKYYNDDDHGSVPLIAEYDALRKFFSWHRLQGVDEYFEPTSTTTADDLIAHITKHYENVSERFGYKVLPPEGQVNGMGYVFLQNGLPQKAFACFKLNTENYPASANVFDSMGDYYLSQKDTVAAIESFYKALSIDSLDYTVDKLAKLRLKNSIGEKKE